jgi:hypothetical protein
MTEPEAATTALGPRQLLGLISANAVVAGAAMFYMGWVYTSAWLGHFHVNPLDLGFDPTEFALRGLNVFSPVIVLIGAVTLIVIGYGRRELPGLGARYGPARWSGIASRAQAAIPRAGLAVTAAGIVAYLLAASVNMPTYLVLALIGGGSLMTTGGPRIPRRDIHATALAFAVAALCGLWAASLYASAKGIAAARETARALPDRTAAVVYSTHRLAIAGPGVQVETLPKKSAYGFRYTGLRLLIARGERYYLLPIGWTEHTSATYVLRDGDDTRVELYSGTR